MCKIEAQTKIYCQKWTLLSILYKAKLNRVLSTLPLLCFFQRKVTKMQPNVDIKLEEITKTTSGFEAFYHEYIIITTVIYFTIIYYQITKTSVCDKQCVSLSRQSSVLGLVFSSLHIPMVLVLIDSVTDTGLRELQFNALRTT